MLVLEVLAAAHAAVRLLAGDAAGAVVGEAIGEWVEMLPLHDAVAELPVILAGMDGRSGVLQRVSVPAGTVRTSTAAPGSGQTKGIEMHSCDICGGTVGDVAMHDQWHARMDDLEAKLNQVESTAEQAFDKAEQVDNVLYQNNITI